jgi:hypothetical protein
VSAKQTADVLQEWVRVKRLHGLTDAQVQMARELGMKPSRLLQAENPGVEPLARCIENMYLRHSKKPLPDSVAPLRQLLHETRARERAEARERRRRKRQSEKDHLEAMRISMLTLRRMYGGLGADDDPQRLSADG